MAPERLTLRIPPALRRRVREQARAAGKTESEYVRELLEEHTPTEATSCYDLAQRSGLIGCVKSGVSDLSTNKRHFEGFGK